MIPQTIAASSLTDILGWRHFPHEADIGICGYGPRLSVAFEEAAQALIAAITTEPIDLAQHVVVFCRAPDNELLFFEWINAIIFEMAAREMIFGRFVVFICGQRLCAAMYGEPIDPKKHQPACEAKGATLTELSVRLNEPGLWQARCVVDV